MYEQLVKYHSDELGHDLSTAGREDQALDTRVFTYGEAGWGPVALGIQMVRLGCPCAVGGQGFSPRWLGQIKKSYGGLTKPGGAFYDIGSGTGKCVRADSMNAAIGLSHGAHECRCSLPLCCMTSTRVLVLRYTT